MGQEYFKWTGTIIVIELFYEPCRGLILAGTDIC